MDLRGHGGEFRVLGILRGLGLLHRQSLPIGIQSLRIPARTYEDSPESPARQAEIHLEAGIARIRRHQRRHQVHGLPRGFDRFAGAVVLHKFDPDLRQSHGAIPLILGVARRFPHQGFQSGQGRFQRFKRQIVVPVIQGGS